MIWGIVAGYVLAAVAFYTYIVATAQEEPQQSSAVVIEINEWQRQQEQSQRKAA